MAKKPKAKAQTTTQAAKSRKKGITQASNKAVNTRNVHTKNYMTQPRIGKGLVNLYCLNVDGVLHDVDSDIDGGKKETDSIVHQYGRLIGYALTTQQQGERDSSDLVAAGYDYANISMGTTGDHGRRKGQLYFEEFCMELEPNSQWARWLHDLRADIDLSTASRTCRTSANTCRARSASSSLSSS